MWLKGKVSQDFRPIVCLNNSTWALMNRQKQFCNLFCFCEDTRKNVCQHVSVVINYVDIVSV